MRPMPKMAGQRGQLPIIHFVRHALYQADDSAALVKGRTTLDVPLIALGASAATHYPVIAKLLGAELIVPDHADVAGAVGAAAGSVPTRADYHHTASRRAVPRAFARRAKRFTR